MVTLNIKDKVRKYLVEDARTRDNDALLSVLIWWKEVQAKGNNDISAVDFLKMYSKNEFTSPESIRRCRQKIQEEEPSLRGTTYKERQAKEKVIRNQVR